MGQGWEILGDGLGGYRSGFDRIQKTNVKSFPINAKQMHESSLLRMKWFTETYLEKNKSYKVLDVGSYGVNGTYRHLFPRERFQYSGLDISPGPNVDIVPNDIYN